MNLLPIELKRVYDILVLILGESKQGEFSTSVSQYQFDCPIARDENGGIPDGKKNLEVSFEKGKFHCWCHDYAGNLSRLIKKWGSNELVTEYFSIINTIKEAKYYDLELFKDNGEDLGYYSTLKLPLSFKKIDLKTCHKQKLIDYLNERKITQDIIDFYNIGYTTWDEEKWQDRDRIIIPSYNSEGDLNYWIGRDFINEKGDNVSSPWNCHKVKYKNCDADKNKIVFQESKIQWNNDIILVEGGLDCLYYPNSIALLGKVLKKENEIYKQLYEKANGNIIICLDGDTKIVETKRIYNLLNVGRLRNKIWYVRLETDELPWKDFGEAYQDGGKENIIKIMKSKKQFNEIELLI